MNLFARLINRFRRELNLVRNQIRVHSIIRQIQKTGKEPNHQPVLFFNASTRLSGLSQNAGFSLITSLALQAAGIPVYYLVCKQGLSKCVLGTDRDNPQIKPPCAECWRTSKKIFPAQKMRFFSFKCPDGVYEQIKSLGLNDLLNFQYEEMPVGGIILPSLRWILRRHHLEDNENIRALTREYILSACQLMDHAQKVIDELNPQAIIVFNGLFYPEAVVRWVGRRNNIKVISHEVGMLPFSAFFTEKEATAYPVNISDDFSLSEIQNARLDRYIESRISGDFVTAGIKFWPEMKKLDDDFLKDINRYKYLVPIFTNVIFDTSQGHANLYFEHMFEWLDSLVEQIRLHAETLFVIRSHPDELREGKESQETVAAWVTEKGIESLDNVRFIPSNQYISSYDLIKRAKFVMVYNSTVGLEASILGKPVLCAGKARYTQIPTVYFPKSKQEYCKMVGDFLNQDVIEQPLEFIDNARRMLFCQLFGASLPFAQFLEDDGVWRGYVRIKNFDYKYLGPENSPTTRVLINGILNNQPFIMTK